MPCTIKHGELFSLIHCKTARCPPLLASAKQTLSFQGQPFPLAQRNTERCPPRAAALQTYAFQGKPFSLAHCNVSNCPPIAWEQIPICNRLPFSLPHFKI